MVKRARAKKTVEPAGEAVMVVALSARRRACDACLLRARGELGPGRGCGRLCVRSARELRRGMMRRGSGERKAAATDYGSFGCRRRLAFSMTADVC